MRVAEGYEWRQKRTRRMTDMDPEREGVASKQGDGHFPALATTGVRLRVGEQTYVTTYYVNTYTHTSDPLTDS